MLRAPESQSFITVIFQCELITDKCSLKMEEHLGNQLIKQSKVADLIVTILGTIMLNRLHTSSVFYYHFV